MIILWDEINLVREEFGQKRPAMFFAASKQILEGRSRVGIASRRSAFSSAKRAGICREFGKETGQRRISKFH